MTQPKSSENNSRNKTKEIKDFSPICFESKQIIWNEIETEIIDSMKETHSFNPTFDLHEHLSRFDTEIKTLEAYEKQIPTEKEILDSLKLIKKQMNSLKNTINKIKNRISKQELDDISQLMNLLNKAGARQRALMANHSIGAFDTLHQAYNYLELLDQNNLLTSLESSLERLIFGIQAAEENHPTPKRGRKLAKLEKGIIHKMLYIYITGTSKKAVCNYSSMNDGYSGDFYNFIMTTLSLLEKKVTLKQLDANTWGDYAREVIKHHYRKKDTP